MFFADMVVWRIAVADSYQIMNKWVGDMRICCFVVKIPTTTKLKTSSQRLYHLKKKFHHQGASECLQDSTHAFLMEVEVTFFGSFRSFSGGIYFQEQTCKHTYNNCIRYSTYVCIYIHDNFIFWNKHLSQYMYINYIISSFLVQLVCSSTNRNPLEALVSSGNRAPKLGCKQETFETV